LETDRQADPKPEMGHKIARWLEMLSEANLDEHEATELDFRVLFVKESRTVVVASDINKEIEGALDTPMMRHIFRFRAGEFLLARRAGSDTKPVFSHLRFGN
jgi:hypothetical protein